MQMKHRQKLYELQIGTQTDVSTHVEVHMQTDSQQSQVVTLETIFTPKKLSIPVSIPWPKLFPLTVGQCGNQIGSAFWPLALQEHGIGNGSCSNFHRSETQCYLSDAFDSFFYCPDTKGGHSPYRSLSDLKRARVKARALLVDMEESVVGRFRTGPMRDLFDKRCLLTNSPGSGNNWAVGQYTHGRKYASALCQMLRMKAEQCDRLHGFILLFSLGGGTGSGLGTALLSMLEDQYPHVDRLVTCVLPGSYNDVVTSPYNVALSLRQLTDHATCVFPVDNKALSDICERLIMSKEMATWKPYRMMNSIAVKMLLHLTSGSRFPGPLNIDMNELATNVVPYPGLHYLSPSLSPLQFSQHKDTKSPTTKPSELLNRVCSRDNELLRINAMGGTLFGAALLGRGDTNLVTMRDHVARLQAKAKFVSWSRNAVKTGLCSVPTLGQTSSLLCIVNSTNMNNLFQETAAHFDKLYKRKAHVHHYLNVEGFDKEEFVLSRLSLQDTIDSYVTSCSEVSIPRIVPV